MVCKKCCCNTDAGLLILRIGIGAIFIYSGYTKTIDMITTVNNFTAMGFNAFWAYLVTTVELLGGVAVLLGVFTRLASILLAITMAVATYVLRDNARMIFVPLTLLFSSMTLILAGSGKYSITKKICNCGSCKNCADNKTLLDK